MLDIGKLKSLGSIKTFKEDDTIFYQEDSGNEMYMILSGKVGIYVSSFDGSLIKLTELSAGDFFGEMSLLDGDPRSATAISCSTTILLTLTKNNFVTFIGSQPSMALKIMKGLCHRIRNLNSDISRLTDNSSQRNLTEKVKDNPLQADVVQKITSSLFPKGHKIYSLIAPEKFNEYIYEKEVKCPVCEESIKVNAQRISRLKQDILTPDLRQKYVDFEPLWYTIWVCPNCNYANFYYDFEGLSQREIKTLLSKASELKSLLPEKFSGSHEINKVFASYYLALFCAERYSAPELKLAKLWLQLSWLYQDMEDKDMHMMASLNAFNYYHAAYYSSNLNISVEQEQQLNIILGELYLLKGESKEAFKCYRLAINKSAGKPFLNNRAQLRIENIRKGEN